MKGSRAGFRKIPSKSKTESQAAGGPEYEESNDLDREIEQQQDQIQNTKGHKRSRELKQNDSETSKRKKSIQNDPQIEINSTSKESKKTKTFYPKISFDPHDVVKVLKENYSSSKSPKKSRRSSRGTNSTIISSSTSSQDLHEFSHELITTTLVNEICQQELNGLKSHFSDERYRTKDTITVHLYKILEDLTNSVADNLPSDVVFTPELSARELHEIEQMSEILSKLQAQYDTLKQYSQDPDELLSKWGVLTNQDVSEIQAKPSSTRTSNDIQRYEKQLDHLTQTINGILDGLDEVARDVNIAKETQEKLYSAHHKERFANPSGYSTPSRSTSETPKSRLAKVPSDTRDLLKGYPK